MPREVTEIPATLTYSQTSKQRKCLRVAAYCRVSTEDVNVNEKVSQALMKK